MKKMFLILLLLIFNQTAFAKGELIPKNKQIRYKKEIEFIINNEYPHIINNINDSVKDAKKIRNKILKFGFNTDDYVVLSLIPESRIASADLDLYVKLTKITKEKYMGIKYESIGTDNVNTFDEILFPYFKENSVNTKKLTKIINYENKKIKVVEKYIKQVERLRFSED